jgi:hypothetical protein
MAQTPEAIAAMRELWPMMVRLLLQPHIQASLRVQRQVVNWDAVNEVERECGLPETPCPETDVTRRLGLKKSEP